MKTPVFPADKERLQRLATSHHQSPREMLRNLLDFYEADTRKDLEGWTQRRPPLPHVPNPQPEFNPSTDPKARLAYAERLYGVRAR